MSLVCPVEGCRLPRAPGYFVCWNHAHQDTSKRYTKAEIVNLVRQSEDRIWERNYREDVAGWLEENL